jgi:uncharacterized protein
MLRRPVHGTPPGMGGSAAMTRLLLFAALAAIALPAQAASFDCTRAATPDEKAICHYRALNDRDVKMATLYALDLRLVPMGSRDAIRDRQADWLTARHACGGGYACLATAYDRRITELQSIIDTRVYPHGPF